MEWHLRERQAWEVSQAGWLVVAGEPAWLTRAEFRLLCDAPAARAALGAAALEG